MLRHDAQAALLDHLRTRCGPSRAYTALGLIAELFRIADWRTGEVLGSDVALAVVSAVSRSIPTTAYRYRYRRYRYRSPTPTCN